MVIKVTQKYSYLSQPTMKEENKILGFLLIVVTCYSRAM